MRGAQKQLSAEANRLQELKSFRQSYAEEHRLPGEISALRWHDYQRFLQRLDNAVVEQKRKLLSEERNLDAHRKKWMVKRQRVESLERIVDRHRQSEERELERQLQKALDDLPVSNGRNTRH